MESTTCSSDRISVKRKSYTIEYKLNAIKKLEENHGNKSLTVRELGISRSLIQDWDKEKNFMERMKEDRNESIKRKRKISFDIQIRRERAKYFLMEKELFQWFLNERELGHEVDDKRWQIKAKLLFAQIYPEKEDSEFMASNGWLWRFCQRYQITNRAITSIGQNTPTNAVELIKGMFNYFDSQAKGMNIDFIGNMDELPVFFDMPSNRTFDIKGVKVVRSRTTGYQKMRFTVVLTIMANGQKLKPMIIFKNLIKTPKGEFPSDVIISVAKGGSMNESLMEKYKTQIWQKRGIYDVF